MSPTHRHSLLVVDDEPDIVGALARVFERNYQVFTTTSVTTAFEILETEDIQVVISDQRMPRMTGVEFLTVVRDQYPEIVRILITGYADVGSVVEAINSGHVYAYVPKPWGADELKAVVARAVDHYLLTHERAVLLEELRNANKILESRNAELAQAYKQLKDLDRVKDVFMELVSHELNTPVSIILGYAFLLEKELDGHAPDARMTRAVQSINGSGIRLRNITKKIFKVLSADKPSLVPAFETVAVAKVLEDVKQQVLPFLDKRNQSLVLDVDPDLSCEMDVAKITDALLNLVMNAIKFSPDGNTIDIKACVDPDDDSQVLLQVQDFGTGISEQDQPRIFQPFFGTFDNQHHSSGDYGFQKRGIGLGLVMVKKFAAMHKGTISFSSKSGEGSTFTIRLPARQSSGE